MFQAGPILGLKSNTTLEASIEQAKSSSFFARDEFCTVQRATALPKIGTGRGYGARLKIFRFF
jgi:hypothetical protein